MVFFSSRISPRASTVILVERSPFATPVVTWAMLRTWDVRFPAMKFTLSVRSFQTPPTPLTSAWPPSLPSVPTSRATRVTSPANALSWSTMILMVFFSSRISPRTSTVILRGEIARGYSRGYFGDVADLSREITSHRVDGIGKILPHSAYAFDLGLASEFTVGTHFARHARYFAREGIKLIHHGVDGVLQLENLSPNVHSDFRREVAFRDSRGNTCNVTNLVGEVARHGVDRNRSSPSTRRPLLSLAPDRRACPPCRPRAPRASLRSRKN